MRALLVEIGGEMYALPLARIVRTLKLPRQEIELDPPPAPPEELCIVVLGDMNQRHGLVVGGFHGERELVVQTLDPRLGKLKNISAGAILADRAPALIVDVDDLLRSVELLASGSRLDRLQVGAAAASWSSTIR